MIYTNTLVEVKVGPTTWFWRIGENPGEQERIYTWTVGRRLELIEELKKVAKTSSELNGAWYFTLGYETWLDVKVMFQ